MSDESIKGNQLTESCTNLVELLQNRALHQPEQKYTFLLDGKTETASLTYRELDAIARSHAARLQALGLTGERVLLLFPPGLDYLAAFFGCLYAKACDRQSRISNAMPAARSRRNLGSWRNSGARLLESP
ncbi:AMP-binding protein [Microcoleus sp. A2-C5]|uniref:AMP-binding protein n=1 Tax=unclassified Microcoleus TaxID=2642155 RepID=UPI002FD026C2